MSEGAASVSGAVLAGNAALVLLLEKTPLNEYGLSDKRVENFPEIY